MAVCEFVILAGLLLHTENGTAEILGDTLNTVNFVDYRCTTTDKYYFLVYFFYCVIMDNFVEFLSMD
jgi:hypothetical protein